MPVFFAHHIMNVFGVHVEHSADVNMTFLMQTRRRFKNPLRVKLCSKSGRRDIFHFMHPVAAEPVHYWWGRTRLYETDYQQVPGEAAACVHFQGFSPDLLHSRRPPSICDSGFQETRDVCLCPCEKIWQIQLSLSQPVDSSAGGWKMRRDEVWIQLYSHWWIG